MLYDLSAAVDGNGFAMNEQEDGEWLESEGAKSVADAKQLTEVRNHLNLLLKLNELHIVIARFTCFCFRSFVWPICVIELQDQKI